MVTRVVPAPFAPTDEKGWPINPRGVGMGPNSAEKLREFRAIAETNAALVENINTGRIRSGRSPFPYYALDPTAGPGAYIQRLKGKPDIRLIGTPLRIAGACHARSLDYHLGFIEVDSVWATHLRTRLAEGATHGHVDLSRVEVLEGRYEVLARSWVLNNVPTYGARGLITPDANGEFGYRTLCALGALKQLECVDFAIHASGSLLKWRRGKGAIQLGDHLAACCKQHWFVGQVQGNWQWVWLFGTNWASYPELKRIGLVPIDSEAGQIRLERLCSTKTEWQHLHQPQLLEEE
jgi:hypothetical protein